MKGIRYIIQEKLDWATISLLVLALAIGLTPSFSVGTIKGLQRDIELRAEDIWMLFLALVWTAAFLKSRKSDIKKPPLFLPIVFWLGIGFLSLLINYFFGNLNVPRGFFYFVKELQFFFVYFFTFFHLRKKGVMKTLIYVWLGVGLANIVWVLTQIFVIGRRGEYGTSALAEWGVFPTATFFLLLFIFLFNWWLYSFWRRDRGWQKEYLYLAAILSIIIGILGALSKTVFVGFFFALSLSVFLYIFKERTKKAVFASFSLFTGVVIFTIGAYFLLILPNVKGAAHLEGAMSVGKIITDSEQDRIEPIIIPQLQAGLSAGFQEYLVGRGKAVILVGTESHNQYVRNFVETGIVGVIAFLFLIVTILTMTWKKFRQTGEQLTNGLTAGLITATLTLLFMSFVVDAFIVVKPNMVFWYFVGLTMAVLYHQDN